MKQKTFIPALRYNWLTRFYNPLVALTMPEKKFKTALIRQAGIAAHHRVLDFGTGTATLSLLLSGQQPGCRIDGVDVDKNILAIAREKTAQQQAKINLVRYDGVKLPYADHTFDRVISSLVFHHLDNEQKQNALSEIRRVLKPGGELHIADWGKASSLLMRIMFCFVQLLDGFNNTRDHVRGKLPDYIRQARFTDVSVTMSFSTVWGTLSLYSAVAPPDDGR